MVGKHILLQTDDEVGARRLTTCLRATGSEVERALNLEAAVGVVATGAIDLVVLDCRDEEVVKKLVRAAGDRVPVLALSTSADPAVLIDLVCDHGVRHLLVHGGSEPDLAKIDAREVVITAEKILRDDLFGPHKYLPDFGVEMVSCVVKTAQDRDTAVACVQNHLSWLGVGREMCGAIGMITDELVTNAVYNAPHDEHGSPRYASRSRRDKITLDPSEYADVLFGSDGRNFVLSVSDRFGRLSPQHIREGLRRCLTSEEQIDQDAGGAGLGLYTVLHSCSQLVINVEPGVRTEVIAIVDVLQRMRGIRASGHSLNVFVGGPRDRAGAIPQPVGVSESMRIDLRSMLTRTESPRSVFAVSSASQSDLPGVVELEAQD